MSEKAEGVEEVSREGHAHAALHIMPRRRARMHRAAITLYLLCVRAPRAWSHGPLSDSGC